jgi:hypothetical protein
MTGMPVVLEILNNVVVKLAACAGVLNTDKK